MSKFPTFSSKSSPIETQKTALSSKILPFPPNFNPTTSLLTHPLILQKSGEVKPHQILGTAILLKLATANFRRQSIFADNLEYDAQNKISIGSTYGNFLLKFNI